MINLKKKWLFPSLLVLAASLALSGCTNDADNTETGDQVEDTVDDAADDIGDTIDDAAGDIEESVREMNYADITVTPDQAFDKFSELHPDAKVKKLVLDKELMEYQYVLEGYDDNDGYEVKMNPVTGEVISDDSGITNESVESPEITKDHVAKVDSIIDKAKLQDGSDSDLDEWKIYVEDGKVVMDVEIGVTEYTYDLDTEELIENDM